MKLHFFYFQKLLSPTSQPQTPQPQILQQQPTPQQPGLAQQPQQPSLVPQLQQGLVRQSVTVSANLVQTEQGPRIILQVSIFSFLPRLQDWKPVRWAPFGCFYTSPQSFYNVFLFVGSTTFGTYIDFDQGYVILVLKIV